MVERQPAKTPGDGGEGQSGPQPTSADEQEWPRKPLRRGDRVGRFVLHSKLGQGGMGTVFLAHDPELQRDVAIKIIKSSKLKSGGIRAQKRMLREAQAMAMVSHPNLVVIYEVGTFGKTIFLAMEYVTGQTLTQWLKDEPPLEEIYEVFEQSASALSAVHRAGLIHRDFKPDNVIVARNGTPKVLDLGIARRLVTQTGTTNASASSDDSVDKTSAYAHASSHKRLNARSAAPPSDDAFDVALTRAGALVGTPAYMPPEQLLGQELSVAVDQFALAVSMYEAFTGQKPFEGRGVDELLANILSRKLRPWPTDSRVPPALQAVIEKALSADIRDRFRSIDELLAACRQGLGLRGQLKFLTSRWQHQGRKDEYLLPEGSLLEQGRALLRNREELFTQEQTEFLKRSLSTADAKRLWRRGLLVGVALLLAGLIPTMWLLDQRGDELRLAKQRTASEHVLFISDKVNVLVGQANSRIEVMLAQRRTWLPAATRLFANVQDDSLLLANVQSLNDYFRPILENAGGISSIKLAREDESEYLLLEDDDALKFSPPYHFFNRVVLRHTFGSSAYQVFSPSSWDGPVRTSWLRVGHPTTRGLPWREYRPTDRLGFRLIENSHDGQVVWTEPYLFFTTKDPGITGTVAFHHDGERYALGIDFMLTDVSLLTTALGSTEYWAVIATATDHIVGLPRDPRFSDRASIRRFFFDEDALRERKAAANAGTLHALPGRGLADSTAELPNPEALGIPALAYALRSAPHHSTERFFSYKWQGKSYVGARAAIGTPELGLYVIVAERPEEGSKPAANSVQKD